MGLRWKFWERLADREGEGERDRERVRREKGGGRQRDYESYGKREGQRNIERVKEKW